MVIYISVAESLSLSATWSYAWECSDVNKDWTCKDKDKDFTYSYLLQVAAKPTIAIEQQQWTQSENSQHMTVKPITLNK